MADNTQLNVPTTAGDIIATDDIGGVQFQRMKITVGADGVNDGDVSSANPMPTKDTNVSATDGGTPAPQAIAIGGVTNTGVAQTVEVNASGHVHVADGGGTLTVDSPQLPSTLGSNANTNSVSVALSSDQFIFPMALRTNKALPITTAPQDLFRCTFAKTITANGVDTEFFNIIGAVGTGQAVSQSSGNLVMTSGTSINAETILRSTTTFSGAMLARIQTILSQRIINNNFFVELVDVIGDGLTASASSATSLTVTIPSNPFTSANVGQSMYIGMLAGGLVGVPNRYAIASVSGNNVTFTVAGFSVTSGTCSLFGWNYYQSTYTSTVNTQVNYDAQRRGWNSGVTTATINATAGVGHMLIMQNVDGNASLLDQLVASATAISTTVRASRVINLPEENTQLYLQLRMLNGSTAPASTTTWTVGMVAVEDAVPLQVSVTNVTPQSQSGAIQTNTNITGGSVVVSASSNIIGNVRIDQTTLGTTNGVVPIVSATAVGAPTPIASTAYATSIIAKASAGKLYSLHGYNSKATDQFIQIHNTTTLPADTAVPAYTFVAKALSNFTLPLPSAGRMFTTGIVVCNSTTGPTKTIGLADCWFNLEIA